MWNTFKSKSKVELSKTDCDGNTEAEALQHRKWNECAIFVNVEEIDNLKYNSTRNGGLGQQVASILVLARNLFEHINQAASNRKYCEIRASAEASDERAVDQRLQTHHRSSSR